MTNVKRFNQELRRLTKRLPEKSLLIVQKKLTFDALRGVVLKTPVDTGRARGNWQVTINESPENEINTEDKTGNNTISEGTDRVKRVPSFAIIYITNNVPYIVYLENGTPTQAAHGMIALTFAELQRSII